MLKRYRDHAHCVWQLRSYLPVMAPGANAVAEATKATRAAIRASILGVEIEMASQKGVRSVFVRDIRVFLKKSIFKNGGVQSWGVF